VQQKRAFLTVSRQRRPQLDELLLALAAQFRPVDARHALERLDEYSRYLFGLCELHPDGQAGCVSHALRHDIGMRPTGLDDAEDLMLDRVLERRRGHPMLLAVVAVELARRAGVGGRLYSMPARWFAGFGEEPIALVELGTGAAAMPSPDMLHGRCAHEVAFGVLCGLRHSYAARARHREADLAAELLRALHPRRA
jgi:hypothetical protein